MNRAHTVTVNHGGGSVRKGDITRRLYPDGRPGPVARALNAMWRRVAAAGLSGGLMASLEVPGRRSGRLVRIPVVPVRVGAHRYLVAMLGPRAGWVRNVRAAGGDATLRAGRRRRVRLVEVPPAERPPIIRAYLRRAPGARPHIPVDRRAPLADFARVKDDVPVFRIDPPSP